MELCLIFFVGPLKEDIFFDHLLWSIFQSTDTYLQITILVGLRGQLSCTASTPLSSDLLWALLFEVLLVFLCLHPRIDNRPQAGFGPP